MAEITCAKLLEIQVKADTIWADNAAKKEYTARCEAAKALISEQTANLIALKDPGKENKVSVQWIDTCNSVVSECGDECIIVGTEAQDTCKEYSLDQCIETSFKVNENKFRTSMWTREEYVAKLLLKADKDLCEEITKRMIASVDSFVGTNAFNGQPGVVAGTDTFIDGAYWTPEIMGYFAEAAIMNKSQDVFLLDGNNLFRQTWLANYQKLNANQGSNMPMLEAIRTYNDLFNMNAVVGSNKMFMIDKGAVAFASKVRYSTTPESITNGANLIRYSIASKNLPGVSFDVIYKTECLDSNIIHSWKLIARFGTFSNPTSACDLGNTGVLSFTCGAAPIIP